jgi:hypothetical protein
MLEIVPAPGGGFFPVGPTASGSVTTGPDGTFIVKDVPSGGYTLCAQGAQPSQLGSCSGWGQARVNGGWSPGVPPQSVTLNVRSGALVRFNVDDPSGLIKLNNLGGFPARGDATNLSVSVAWEQTPRGFDVYSSKYVSTSGGRWTYQIPVLIRVPLHLFVSTSAAATVLDPQENRGQTGRFP